FAGNRAEFTHPNPSNRGLPGEDGRACLLLRQRRYRARESGHDAGCECAKANTECDLRHRIAKRCQFAKRLNGESSLLRCGVNGTIAIEYEIFLDRYFPTNVVLIILGCSSQDHLVA